MKLFDLYNRFVEGTAKLQSFSLLFLRLVLAYGFYTPAMNKWADIGAVAQWFGSMGYPWPLFNAYAAATTELVGVFLLTIGFLTRVIAVPLMVVMVVAITTVHWSNGFSSGDNGFEIPLYYMIMLIALATHGGGRFSLDYFIFHDEA